MLLDPASRPIKIYITDEHYTHGVIKQLQYP
jgi:hypothetical protein